MTGGGNVSGWIKLHRKIREKAVWQDPEMLKLWIYCLLKASHRESEEMIEKQKVKIGPGQFVTGRFILADEYNKGAKPSKVVPANTLWRWLKRFEEWGMLSIKSTNKYSVVTIKKWHAYQQNEQQMNNRWATDEQQVSTYKNVKNVKEDKEDGWIDDAPPDPKEEALQEIQAHFIMRRARGTAISTDDMNLMSELMDKEGFTKEEIIEGIDEAFRRFKPRWQGDYVRSFKYCADTIRTLRAEKNKPTNKRQAVGQFNDLPRAVREQLEREASGEGYDTTVDPAVQAEILAELERMRERHKEKKARAGGQ